jgi:hypothetical protein
MLPPTNLGDRVFCSLIAYWFTESNVVNPSEGATGMLV